MKREGQLLPRIATRENLAQAFHRAAQGKRSVAEVASFAAQLDRELNRLVAELREGSWHPGPYRRFVVRDPKVRVIHASPFRDRVLHHAVMRVAGPVFERGASAASHACRTGRGNRAAVQEALQNTTARSWFLKLDVRRYFDSIPHDRLRGLFRRRFKDGAFLALLDRLVAGFSVSPGRGLPIGTLTSQYFANFYLDGLDRFVTGTLGIPDYVRYMDDFVLWHDDPVVLDRARDALAAWLAEMRGLELKVRSVPRPCPEGLPFLGYRLVPRRILLGRAARRRFRQRLAGHERAWMEGRLDARGLQRRVDALLAFTDLASCRHWRRRVVRDSRVAGDPNPDFLP